MEAVSVWKSTIKQLNEYVLTDRSDMFTFYSRDPDLTVRKLLPYLAKNHKTFKLYIFTSNSFLIHIFLVTCLQSSFM